MKMSQEEDIKGLKDQTGNPLIKRRLGIMSALLKKKQEDHKFKTNLALKEGEKSQGGRSTGKDS